MEKRSSGRNPDKLLTEPGTYRVLREAALQMDFFRERSNMRILNRVLGECASVDEIGAPLVVAFGAGIVRNLATSVIAITEDSRSTDKVAKSASAWGRKALRRAGSGEWVDPSFGKTEPW